MQNSLAIIHLQAPRNVRVESRLRLRILQYKKGVGVGAGHMNLPDRPNLLRVLLFKDQDPNEQICVHLEANIDDGSPEHLAYLKDVLFFDPPIPSQRTPGQLGM